MIDILLRLAKDDLKASRLLFKRKIYPPSIFHLQQAVEKAVKALGMSSAQADLAELKQKVGHNPVKIFIKSLTELSDATAFFAKLPAINPAALHTDFYKTLSPSISVQNEETKKSVAFLSNLKNLGIENIDTDSLDDIIHEIKSFELHRGEKVQVGNQDLSEYHRQMTSLIGFLEKFSKEKADEFRQALEKLEASGDLKRIMKALIEIYPIVIYITFALYYLSIVLFPHPVDTRYPDQERDFNPYQRYTRNYPMIVRMSEIQSIVGKVLFQFRKLTQKPKKK